LCKYITMEPTQSITDGSLQLPTSRIRTIMKSSPEVNTIGAESLFLITKATELFVQELARMSLEKSANRSFVDYNDLANIVDHQETLQFLQDIIPKKIKYSEYLALAKKDQSSPP
jgi:chromatin accessibility complex protein 1